MQKTTALSKEHPETIFRWDLSKVSQETSEDLLYILDATPSTEPTQYDAGNGATRTRQEYSSSTGLSFIDVRDIGAGGMPLADSHKLYVYLPAKG